jgi:hypothetical protein
MILELHEQQSALAKKVLKGLYERLDTLRKQNDKHRTEAETAAIRGSIQEIKALIKDFEEPGVPAPKKLNTYA